MKLSVIVPAIDASDVVFPAVEQVHRSQADHAEVLILCATSMPPDRVGRLQAMWRPSLVRCVTVADESPGAVRNAGIASSSGELIMFLEPGDTIDPAYPGLATDRFATSTDLDFVTAGTRQGTPPVLSLEALLAGRDSLPGPTVFLRSIWESLGRFDEGLMAWEWNDFWVRLLASGGRGHVIDQPLIGHQPSRASAYRRRLEADRSGAGMRPFFEKHIALVRTHVTHALCDRETSLRALASSYQRLLRRRDRLVEERASLQARSDQALEQLRALGIDRFDWGDLRRTTPVSTNWGYERGVPIDRYYIERFLEAHAADVQGTVLEIQEPDYTRRFGRDRVTRSDVIDAAVENTRANLTGDLRDLHGLPSNTYDCFILTQTIHVVNDMHAVIREAVRILKPGGVLLATMPCVSRVCLEYGPDGDFWRVTEAGVRELFRAHVPPSHMEIQTFGNALASIGFTAGLATHEISAEEFETHDPFNPTLVGIRAVKPAEAAQLIPRRRAQHRAAILLYHRVAAPPLDVHELCVSPAVFREQMQHLQREYQPVPLAQLAMAARDGWLPERAVAITFDDGYLDNLAAASPILCELGLPATFFLTTAGLRSGAPFWWDVLESVFFKAASVPSRLEVPVGGELRVFATGTDQERERAHWDLYHLVRQADASRRAALMQHIASWAGWTPDPAVRAMTSMEVQDLARRPGHSVGGHGRDHLSYSSQPADTVRADVGDNRALLESVVGRLVTSFAYPFGDYDDQAVEIVEDAGYRAAVTCDNDIVRPGTHPLRLPRLAVGPKDDIARFEELLRSNFERVRRSEC